MNRQRQRSGRHAALRRTRKAQFARDIWMIATIAGSIALTRVAAREIADESIFALRRIDQRDCAVVSVDAKKLAALRQ